MSDLMPVPVDLHEPGRHRTRERLTITRDQDVTWSQPRRPLAAAPRVMRSAAGATAAALVVVVCGCLIVLAVAVTFAVLGAVQ